MIQLTENQREILQALLDGRDIEATDVNNKFYDVTTFEGFISNTAYFRKIRIKPRTILVNGVEVPEPMKVKPEEGTLYYIATPYPESPVTWVYDKFDEDYFNAGICHSTPEAAALHWEAMIKPSKIVQE